MITESGYRVLQGGEVAFKICLFFYSAFGACSLTYKTQVISVMLYAMTALGLALMFFRALNYKRYIRMPLLICAALMWASYIVSTLFNLRYVTKGGLVYLGLWTLYFFLLYTHDEREETESVCRDLRWFSVLYLIWTTALALISFGMLAAGYGFSYEDTENAYYTVAVGFNGGRLWGAFQDPNLGAVMCCAAIAICVYWFRREKKTWLRGALAADIAAMLFYIALSDSRNGMLCMGVMCAVGAAFAQSCRKKQKRPAAVRLLIIALAFAVGTFAPYALQKAYNVASSSLGLLEARGIERDYVLDNTVAGFSNRRVWVWKSAVEIGMSRPLTGVSFSGVLPYVREYMPETYIVNNGGYWDMNTFDSEIFNIFAAQGIPGLLILLCWFALAAILFFRSIGRCVPTEMGEVALLTVISCVLITSALNQGTMFYQTTPNTVLFWLVFGDLMFILKKRKEQNA